MFVDSVAQVETISKQVPNLTHDLAHGDQFRGEPGFALRLTVFQRFKTVA